MYKPDYDNHNNRVLPYVLKIQAQQQPQQRFLWQDKRALSYQETWQQVQHYACGLDRIGVGRGDRVVLFYSGDIEFVLLALACNCLGAIWIPINTDYRGEWLSMSLEDSDPSLVISDSGLLNTLLAVLDPAIPVICDGAFEDAGKHDIRPLETLNQTPDTEYLLKDLYYGDTNSVLWTSGTTGRSKGVMQSHNTWVRASLSAAEMGATREGDVFYNCLPLYNSAAWTTGIFPALLTGTCCAMDHAFSASNFWERSRYYGATQVFTLGAMHMFLWQAPPSEDDLNNPLRSAQMVPMPEEVIPQFRERFGIEAIHQGFGQSECMFLLRRGNDGIKQWPANALGEIAPDLDIALLDDDGNPVAVGEPGECCVREKQPHAIFNGYFNNPEATKDAFHGDWYRTGDLLRQDENGHFFFVDRKKDLIRYKGRSVSSVAIESIACRHPSVQSAAAFGLTSEQLEHEHEIALAIIADEDLNPAELARFINDNAPHFFVPRYIVPVDTLPMTPTQKVQKNKLREMGLNERSWDAKAEGFEVKR